MTAIERIVQHRAFPEDERWPIQWYDPRSPHNDKLEFVSSSDLRLAADCIAFVRDMAIAFGPGDDPPAQPRHTWVIGHSWCHHLDAFAARIKEASL